MSLSLLLLASLEQVERDILYALTCTWHDDTLGWILIQVQRKGVGIPLALLGLGLLAWRRRQVALRVLSAALVGFGLCTIVAAALWPIVARERPPHHYERVLRTDEELATCAQHPEALALRNPRISNSWSFPSRHAIAAGVVATAFGLAGLGWGLLVLPFCVLVAVGRLYAGRHWPTDVLAGWMLGVLGAYVAWRWTPALFGWLGRRSWIEPPAANGEQG